MALLLLGELIVDAADALVDETAVYLNGEYAMGETANSARALGQEASAAAAGLGATVATIGSTMSQTKGTGNGSQTAIGSGEVPTVPATGVYDPGRGGSTEPGITKAVYDPAGGDVINRVWYMVNGEDRALAGLNYNIFRPRGRRRKRRNRVYIM